MATWRRIGSLKPFARRPAGRARPSISRRRSRRAGSCGVPSARRSRPTGAARSQAERGAARSGPAAQAISRATSLWLIPYPCVRSQAVIRPNAIQRGRRVLSIEQPHQMEGLRTYLVSLIIQTRPREAQQGTLASHTDLGKTADNDMSMGY